MSIFAYRKRLFLNPVSTSHTSYILAEVESSAEGNYKVGTNMIVLADCRRSIQLEFSLGNSQARREALAKANLMVNVLTGFRDALEAEIELIESTTKP